MSSEADSKKFKLNTKDAWVLAKNALLVGGAAALTFVGENLSNIDFGTTGVLFVPVVAVALDTLIKWMKDNTKKVEE
jgi:hypothetical protein